MPHIPVLLDETINLLNVRAGGRYIDGTLGRAGHSREIIRRGGVVLGIDRDEQAIAEVAALHVEGLTVARGCHGDLSQIARAQGWFEVEGILLDLGVSSPQLDEAARGFSFLRDGPLDMRMDRSGGISAADLVNGESEDRLAEIFRLWGEEPQARRIARAIVRAREQGVQFRRTMELADFIERLVGRRGAHHPATRVFQALRMETNAEVDELRRALSDGLELLKGGGRFAVITFESTTDRVVKQFFSNHVGRTISLQQGGAAWQGDLPKVRAVTKKPVVASERELDLNPRARSAKLRVVEKE